MEKRKALISGITGQDGSYLAEILLEKDYEVHGILRASATDNTKNIEHIINDLKLHKGDLCDPLSIYRTIAKVKPAEIYNEADQDHVAWSYDTAAYSYDVTGAAVGRFLEMIKEIDRGIKYFQPLSSNIFGNVEDETKAQNENSPLNPQSPYACGKALAYHLVKYYRDVEGLFATSAIFFNHESERRTEKYFTHKVTKAAVEISKGIRDKLEVGDIDLGIDWGYAKEYMEAAYNIMQLKKPQDFIICTGEIYSLRDFLKESFKQVGLDYVRYVRANAEFIRKSKTSTLRGDYSKAKKEFGFEPKVKFKEIVKMLIEHDKKELEKRLNEKL
ncbi:MAG: GDP-mannose 4,6-dehydratase [Candidatus Nanoarchaeia archaeon]